MKTLKKIAIIYNEPTSGRYDTLGEQGAINGVLDAVESIKKAVTRLNYDYITLPLYPPLAAVEAELQTLNADIIFNLCEGFDDVPESEASVVGILEKMGFCFTGCPSSILHLCENKVAAKNLLRLRGIPVPDWQLLYPDTVDTFNINFPCIVKPSGEHASHGLSEKSVVKTVTQLKKQVDFIWQSYEHPSIVEEFLPGREFRVFVVGNSRIQVLPPEEIIYDLPSGKPKILTYFAKWVPGHEYFIGTREVCPAKINDDLSKEVNSLAKRTYRALKCSGYASIDMRQDRTGRLMVIEVNPNTDISANGSAKYPVQEAGIEYHMFIKKVINLARVAYITKNKK